jgi:DNA-binding SARP family transcriptional activator
MTPGPGQSTEHPNYHIALAGSFALVSGERSLTIPHSAERVLAYLALAGTPVPRVKLAGVLWRDSPRPRAANNLRTALWRRQQTGTSLVTGIGNQLRLTSDVAVDIAELAELARRLIRDPGPAALGTLPALLDWPELLPDWDDDWVLVDKERLRVLRLEALEQAASTLVGQHRLTDALLAARAALDTDPLRESACRIVIEIHLVRGNIAEAINQFRGYRDLLRTEFGVGPSPAMTRLLADRITSP